MASKVEVSNLALSMIGEPSIISLSDDNQGAKAVSLWFDTARDAVLEDHKWNFAMKRVTMALSGTSPEFGFENKYKLPNDFIRLIRFDPDSDPNYRIEGEFIVSDSDNPELIYVHRVEDMNIWPAAVRVALAARLAHETAPLLKNSDDRGTADNLWQIYQAKLSLARSYDGQQNPPLVIEADEFLEARFGYFIDPRFRDIDG